MTVPPAGRPDAAQQPGLPTTYTTGSWLALVLDDLALLLDLPADSRLLGQCWSAAAGQGLDGVLAVITQPGPHAVANYAAVARTPDATRVVVAGSARADIGGTAVSADGGAVRDERFGGRAPVRLLSGPGAGAEPAVLPLTRGIAPAGAIGVGVLAAASEPSEPARPTEPATDDRPVEPAVDPVPVPRVSSDTMPPASVYDSGIIESLPWRGTGELEPAASPAPPPPAPPPPAPSAPPASSSDGQWGDPYAGAPDPNNPWGAPAPEAVPGPPPGGAWESPAAPQQPASPWAPPEETAAAQLNPTAAAPAPPLDESGGPVVHAFACPRGHLNPPYAGTCRICDEPIAAQEGFAAPRPSLGVLKLSTGDTVPLDRDVVLGRAPFHADESAASRPHLVQLASPGNDISRSHVRVNLENWFVQVTDLGSTNGTVVTLPDQAPVRLRPHDPFTILPGTSVNIADEITLRYEVS